MPGSRQRSGALGQAQSPPLVRGRRLAQKFGLSMSHPAAGLSIASVRYGQSNSVRFCIGQSILNEAFRNARCGATARWLAYLVSRASRAPRRCGGGIGSARTSRCRSRLANGRRRWPGTWSGYLEFLPHELSQILAGDSGARSKSGRQVERHAAVVPGLCGPGEGASRAARTSAERVDQPCGRTTLWSGRKDTGAKAGEMLPQITAALISEVEGP